MKAMTLGNGKTKTLADAQVGDEVAVLNHGGHLLRIAKIARRTESALWVGTHRSGWRFSFTTGKQIQGKNFCRLPTAADRKKQKKAKEEGAARYRDQQIAKTIQSQEEYQLAKHIGYMLCDFDHGTEENYLAFARRIGLERLRAFKDSIEESRE
jgi:hypothetical protein